MKKIIILPVIIFAALILTSFTAPKKIHIWLIGDSTMCEYDGSRAPQTGWGMPFAGFFDSTVQIENRARGGRSTKTFIGEGLWSAVLDSLQEGDYVFIQFGHNDEAKAEKYKERYTPVPDYKVNLEKFIVEARSKKAIPVLITPVTRLRFDGEGKVLETHREYSPAVIEIGKKTTVPVIDLDGQSRALLQQMGTAAAPLLYMQLDSLEHPNFPSGQKDATHFNAYGARRIAELVLASVRTQLPELAQHIIIGTKK